jgi:hypothetical protein
MTPYRRVLQSEYITNEEKDKLNEVYVTLNPAELKRGMMKVLNRLEKFRVSA